MNPIGNCCQPCRLSRPMQKELACCTRFTKLPVYDRIRKLEESGLIKKYVAVLEAVHASFLHGRILFPYPWKVRKLEWSNHSAGQSSDFSWMKEWLPDGGCKWFFLIKTHREGLNDYHQFFLRQASSTAQYFSDPRVPSCFHEIKNSTWVPIY